MGPGVTANGLGSKFRGLIRNLQGLLCPEGLTENGAALSHGFICILLGLPRWLSDKRICLPTQEMWVQSLGQEDPLEEEMATHHTILAWRIPRTEEPQSMG